MITRIDRWASLLVGAAIVPCLVHAEISGSGTPNHACPNQIGDRVWRDLDGNGVQDAGEPGIAGVVVRLERAGPPDMPYLLDTTDANGHFRFYNLCDGSYWLDLDETTLPADLIPTQAIESTHTHPALDNDADQIGNRQHVVVSPSEQTALTVDFGFRQGQCTAAAGDRVWFDLNRNGIQDPGEKGIADVTVRLMDAAGHSIAEDRTDADGGYRFDELCAGSYTIDIDESGRSLTQLTPSPAAVGNDPAVDSDGPSDAGAVAIDIGAGAVTDLDFGYYHPSCTASVGDRVFVDGIGEGIQRGDERGIPGVRLTLMADGDDIPLAATRTDSAGSYTFTGLCSGQYTVDLDERTLPGAYNATQAFAGADASSDSDATATGEPIDVILITDDAIDESIDFGFQAVCAGRVGDRVWLDADADGVQDPGEPGLAGIAVELRDNQGRHLGTATSDGDGRYGFGDLCPGEYAVQVEAHSVPAGVRPTAVDVGNDASDSDGGTPVWLSLDSQSAQALSIDFGYTVGAHCDIALDAGCLIVPADKALYECGKPIDALTLVWNGSSAVRVVAHRGKQDNTVLADIDPVTPGQELTVNGFAGGPNDVEYEIYATGTDDLLGISRFNIDCADDAMSGPDDCGSAQGDGKDDKTERINDWLLEGMIDATGVLDCTTDLSAATDSCVFEATRTSCDTVDDDLRIMTMAYSGGGCGVSEHGQGSKFKCSGNIDGAAAITVTLEDGQSFIVEPGQVFGLPADGSDTKFDLSNPTGTEHQEIHTSCSKPLIVGDVFGSLTLMAINGEGLGTDMLLVIRVDNVGPTHIATLRLVSNSDLGTDPGNVQHTGAITKGAHLTTVSRIYLTTADSFDVVATADDVGGNSCGAADALTIDVTPPPSCAVIPQAAIEFHDKEVRWQLRNNDVEIVHLDQLQILWPLENGHLEEIKLGGDKIFDARRDPGSTTITASDWTDEIHKRAIQPGDDQELKLKFAHDVVEAVSDYGITVNFAQGCQLSH